MSNQDRKIIVLFGGTSDEHAVSFGSGQQVVRTLVTSGVTCIPVYISRQDEWYVLDPQVMVATTLTLDPDVDTSVVIPEAAIPIAPVFGLKSINHDLIFIAMHGPGGEDGRLQGALELAGLQYVGSGMLASALGMDKAMFGAVLTAYGLPQAKTLVVSKSDGNSVEKIKSYFSQTPVVVKPSDQGSSVGVSIVHNWDELDGAVQLAFNKSRSILVQEYLSGREFTVGVIGTNKLQVLPVIEIIPEHEFFDYESKYLSTTTSEICPADIPPGLSMKMQDLASKTYSAIGCRNFARIDFLLDEKGEPRVLEVNTIPGLTPASLVPKAAQVAGYSFPEFIDWLIEDALAHPV